MAIVGSKAITKVVKVVLINVKVGRCLDCTEQGLSDVAVVTGPVATMFKVCSIVSDPWTETVGIDTGFKGGRGRLGGGVSDDCMQKIV